MIKLPIVVASAGIDSKQRRKNARACIGKGSRGTGCCSLPPCKARQVTGRTSAWKDLEKKNNTARNG